MAFVILCLSHTCDMHACAPIHMLINYLLTYLHSPRWIFADVKCSCLLLLSGDFSSMTKWVGVCFIIGNMATCYAFDDRSNVFALWQIYIKWIYCFIVVNIGLMFRVVRAVARQLSKHPRLWGGDIAGIGEYAEIWQVVDVFLHCITM